MQMPAKLGPIHIVGIGGIGMSAIAEVLHDQGYAVQGSDQKDGYNLDRLRAKGMKIFVGHEAKNIDGAAYVVISTAVKTGNPELDGARAKGLPVIRRAEILAEIMRRYSTISVTGTPADERRLAMFPAEWVPRRYSRRFGGWPGADMAPTS